MRRAYSVRSVAQVSRHSAHRRLSNRLWIHRKKLGYSQREVATFLGHRSAARVSDYERGRRLPSLETALKLEAILCVPVAFLFEDLYRRLRLETLDAKARRFGETPYSDYDSTRS